MKVVKLAKTVRFFLHFVNEAPRQKSKKDQNYETATVAIVRSNHKLGCVSQDVELPEPMGRLTDVRS